MVFLVDENVDRVIINSLREDGFTVLCVGEIAPSIPDNEVIDLANNESALLLTEDKGFGELIFEHEMFTYGIVLVRLSGLSSYEKAKRISEAIRDNLYRLQDRFTVISKDKVRMRSY